MIKKLEKTYGSALKGVFFAVNPLKKKMLKTNCTVHKYINIKAVDLLKIEDYEKEYELQDATVPQHVNNKLLKSHRKFELWIISKLMTDYSFDAEEGIIKYDELQDFIVNNAIMANDTYLRSINIKNTDKRYAKIATTIIHEAQKTTAGFLLLFYEEMKVKNKILL